MPYTPREFKRRSRVIPVYCHVRDLGSSYSSILNLSECVLIQVAKANSLVEPLHRALKLNECRLHFLESTSNQFWGISLQSVLTWGVHLPGS